MAEKKNKKDILDKETNDEKVADESMSQAVNENSGEKNEDAESEAAQGQEHAAEEPAETVEVLKAQVQNWNDRYLRLMAEFDNYKKRSSREYQTMVDSANERLMTDLVDVRESFERAVKSSEQAEDYKTIFEGLKLIFSKFDTVLVKHGLEVFGAPGEPFDPMEHDALMKTPHQEIPEDHIADIYERGYRLKGKVMKHARVIVSSGKPEGDNEEKKTEK
ncbi:MAG: nucleotide exchange factor GrpE [Chitinispirillaceae bacterium]|nr:nucleotide exchange factor GrpE [Chitinispirillaceae bacterium]